MLSIDQKPMKLSLQQSKLEVPMDDYILNMVLRRGRIVSSPRKPIFVEAIDLANHDGLVHSFRMSMVDSFQTSETYPEFSLEGLVGTWRLVGSTGQIKLLKAFENRNNSEAVKSFLLNSESHSLARDRYTTLLSAI